MRVWGAVVLLLVTSLVQADATRAEVRAEIDTLLSRLEQSGCEFYRNGSWYAATEAKTHLQRKLKAAGAAGSTEQFIDALASKSSMSGKPYLVRCGDAAP